jgi:hypothetical protein
LLTYLHPLTAALILLLTVYVAWLGIRSRNDRRNAKELLRRHRRLAPSAYALILISWLAGVATTWALRPELALGESQHFRVGLALVAVLTASAISSRWMRHAPVRTIHPWFGVAAMLLAAAQVFFGLQITP